MEDLAEVVGALRLPLGGLNGYLSVRGKQGRKRDKYQGCSLNKTRRTKLFKTLRQAAIAFAKLMKDTENDPIAHLDFSSPSMGPSGMLREPTCSPMEGARLHLMPPGLTLVCGNAQSRAARA